MTQWIERSKSCPQCRERVTQKRVHKLYLTVANNETNVDNDFHKEDKITSLTFQITLKEKDIRHFMSKCATLEKQNMGLRKEVRKLESEICEKNSVIHALKEQIKYFKDQLSQCENAKKEVTQLKKKLEELRNVQMLLDAPVEGVEDIIGRDKSTSTLLTYVYVMKKEILSNLSKIKHLRMKVKDLQNENARMIMKSDGLPQNYFSNEQLEERLAFCESEKMALQSKVTELETMLDISSHSKDTIDLLEEEKSKCEISKEHLENSVLQKSSSRKRSHSNSKPRKSSMEKRNTSCLSIVETRDDNFEIDSTPRSTNSDSSIALKKSKPSKAHEKMNSTNNMQEEDDNENIVGSSYADSSTNMCSKIHKEKEEKIRKDKLNKTRSHKRNIIDLT